MTAPYDFRRDVEIPDDLIARLCAGEKQEKVTFNIKSFHFWISVIKGEINVKAKL